MSHSIHTTKAFVLDSRNLKEADKEFVLFTEDLGLIKGLAQGIRKITSKLSFVLKEYSYVEISFVKAKYEWRIVNAFPIHTKKEFSSDEVSFWAKIFGLISKLTPQEEINPKMFSDLENYYLEKTYQNKEEKIVMEIMCILSILNNLGYWGDEVVSIDSLNMINKDEKIDFVLRNKKEIISSINKSMRLTGLI